MMKVDRFIDSVIKYNILKDIEAQADLEHLRTSIR
jgi:hypothetical protein